MAEKSEVDNPPSSSVSSSRDTRNKLKMEFVPGTLLEARDFNNEWFSAKVVEVDWEDREVLVHFQNWSSRYDEWISMDSARLRPVSQNAETSSSKGCRNKDYKVGEKVMAVWNNNKKYPAQITAVLEGGLYEVVFYDGITLQVKGKQISRLPKEQAEKIEIPALQPPESEKDKLSPSKIDIIGSKEERRKRKRKLEVSNLFRYYNKKKNTSDTSKSNYDHSVKSPLSEGGDNQIGRPTPAMPQLSQEKKDQAIARTSEESVKLNDSKLPPGWEKQAKLKNSGSKAGKWDVVIIGPESRTFRSRHDIKQYLIQQQLNYDLDLFDFRLGEDFYRERGMEPPKRAKDDYVAPGIIKQYLKSEQVSGPSDSETSTFTPENDGYRCPLHDCRKLFRRDNLLLMHIKHYHPALLKKLGCKTLRVEDLAAARTAFETDDIKPSVYAQSILSALSNPSPSSPPQKAEKSIDSPILEDLLSIPLSKRISSVNQTEASTKTTVAAPSPTPKSVLRRKSEKLAQSEDADVAENNVEAVIAAVVAGENLTEEVNMQKIETEILKPEVVASLLDDIPGQKELVHCFCGSPEEDGLMIQCELCLCWQHGICLGIDSEDGVPDPYICQFCRCPYKERLSQRYTHDQTWLKKGTLSNFKFINEASSATDDKALRLAGALTAAATDLKLLLHSLKFKICIAMNKNHHKLYLWAEPWNSHNELEEANTPKNDESNEGRLAVPNVPLPEAPINAVDCRLNLLSHIKELQSEIDSRLESLESLFEEYETEEGAVDTALVGRIQLLLKDVMTLKRMATLTINY